MADISKITLPSGTTYDLKDTTAREQINSIKSTVTGQMHYAGVTTTALANGSTTKPIQIGGANYTQSNGDVVIETLTIGWTDGTFNPGSLPTAGKDVQAATGVKSASFTGTAGQVTVK